MPCHGCLRRQPIPRDHATKLVREEREALVVLPGEVDVLLSL
ncbi:MAG TPA: hypothetical protein VJV79_03420 [Polyangiaceae bacterium]|nr:hypothetical protein [Polyangiaceae bacterium]